MYKFNEETFVLSKGSLLNIAVRQQMLYSINSKYAFSEVNIIFVLLGWIVNVL